MTEKKDNWDRERELFAAFRRAREAGWDPPPEHEFREDPADRYYMLPKTTRKWFESLRVEDSEEMEAARKFYAQARLVGKVNLWVIGTIAGAMTLGVAFGENIVKVFSWIRGH